MRREKRLLINSFILGLGNVLPKISTFITLPILTSALSKFEFGKYDLIVTSMSFILPLFSLLVEQAVFRFLLDSNSEDKKKLITNSALYILISSIFLYFLGQLVLKQFEYGLRILICVYVVLNLYYTYAIQVCRGLGLLKKYSFSSIINTLLNLLFVVLLVGKMETGFYGLITSLVVSIFVASIFAIHSSGIIKLFSLKLYDSQCIKGLLTYSIPLLPNSISWWIIGVSDRWIIATMLGVEMNAIYAVSNKIPSMFNLIYNNFNLAWQESASITYKDSDVTEYYTNIFNYLFNFLAGMLLILITISPIIFKVFIHESYSIAYYQIPILFLAMFFNSMASYYGGIYVALKKSKNMGLTSFFAAFLNVLINFVFISRVGLYAASFSTLASYFLLTLYRAIDVQKYIHIKYNLIEIINKIAIITIIAVVSYLNIYYLNIINFVLATSLSIILNEKTA